VTEKQIKITVKKGGQIKVEAEGYSGSSCTEATKFLEKLGAVVEPPQMKPEFYQTEDQGQSIQG